MILYAFVVAKLADFGLPKLKYLIRFSSFVVFSFFDVPGGRGQGH